MSPGSEDHGAGHNPEVMAEPLIAPDPRSSPTPGARRGIQHRRDSAPAPMGIPTSNHDRWFVAQESSHVRNNSPVALVHEHFARENVQGRVVISVRRADTPAEWCDFYGLPVQDDGTVVLYKGVEDDWRGPQKTEVTWRPGSVPEAPDWAPTAECGRGLHLSPHPTMTLDYCFRATHFLAVPVTVDGIVVLGDRVKVRRASAPIWEVDRWTRQPIGAAA